MREIERLIEAALKVKATAIHLAEGRAPFLRFPGQLRGVDTPIDLDETLAEFLEARAPRPREGFEEIYVQGAARLRLQAAWTDAGWSVTLWPLSEAPPQVEAPRLKAALEALAVRPHGLALLASPPNHGRGAAAAALVEAINRARPARVLIIGEPHPYAYSGARALIDHTPAPDPERLWRLSEEGIDVLLIDADPLEAGWLRPALAVAEAGILVILTLQGGSAARALRRLLCALPASERRWAGGILSRRLAAVVAQRKLRTTDGAGEAVAAEIFWGGAPAVMERLRGGGGEDLEGLIRQAPETVTMDDALFALLKRGRVLGREAHLHARDKQRFAPFLS